MQLDKHGITSVTQIILYIPILAIAGILVLRHGFSRRASWVSLLILAVGEQSSHRYMIVPES